MIAYKVFERKGGRLRPIIQNIDFIDPEKYIIQRPDDCGPFQCYPSYESAYNWDGEIWKVKIKVSKEQKYVWTDPAFKRLKYAGAVILADEFEILERIR